MTLPTNPEEHDAWLAAEIERLAKSGERAPYPHCDGNILHAPGTCQVCDHYPERHAARRQAGVNFTGEHTEGLALCPAERARPLQTIERWGGVDGFGGNRRVTAETEAARGAYWDGLRAEAPGD